MNSAILGIDPGLSGALALYDVNGQLEVVDMPTHQLRTKRVIDEYGLARIIDNWSTRIGEVWLEQVGTRPGEGAVGAFTFGRGYGAIRGICAANFLTINDVTPASWKAAMKVRGDKDESRRQATALFPRYADQWSRKKDDGRAEAALLAMYGMRQAHLGRVA
jgi:crossover junction endodeoxyribonuclease RuvC